MTNVTIKPTIKLAAGLHKPASEIQSQYSAFELEQQLEFSFVIDQTSLRRLIPDFEMILSAKYVA